MTYFYKPAVKQMKLAVKCISEEGNTQLMRALTLQSCSYEPALCHTELTLAKIESFILIWKNHNFFVKSVSCFYLKAGLTRCSSGWGVRFVVVRRRFNSLGILPVMEFKTFNNKLIH